LPAVSDSLWTKLDLATLYDTVLGVFLMTFSEQVTGFHKLYCMYWWF